LAGTVPSALLFKVVLMRLIVVSVVFIIPISR
jgi:hypothetical protein